jgi:hypothetical protein
LPDHDLRSLGVHEVKLVGQSRPSFGDGRSVGEHAHSAVNLGKISVGDHLRWLVADTNLEASWAPVNELDGALGLQSGNGRVDVVRNNITTVQQASSHVLAGAGVTLDHLVVGLEARVRDLLDRVGFVLSLGSRNDGGVGDQGEVDAGIWHQVGLELVQIDVERAVKAKRGSDG